MSCKPAILAFLCAVAATPGGWAQGPRSARRPVVGRPAITREWLDAEAARTEREFRILHEVFVIFRREAKECRIVWPFLARDVEQHPERYGSPGAALRKTTLWAGQRRDAPNSPYAPTPLALRPDGTLIGRPKPPGTRDVLAARYLPAVPPAPERSAFAVVLWEDGRITREPRRRWVRIRLPSTAAEKRAMREGKPGWVIRYTMAIMGQPGTLTKVEN